MDNGLELFAQGIISNNLILMHGLGLFVLTRYTRDVSSAAKVSISMLLTIVTASMFMWLFRDLVINNYVLQVPIIFLLAAVAAFFLAKSFSLVSSH